MDPSNSVGRMLSALVTVVVLALVVSFPVWAGGPGEGGNGPGGPEVTPVSSRNFDARIETNRGLDHRPGPAQLRALEQLASDIPGLLEQIDRTTGVTRSLFHPTGALTDGPVGGRTPRENARAFLELEIDALGLDLEDLDGMEVTDEVLSPITGVSHVYFRQTLGGIPVYQSQLHVNVDGNGRIQSVNNAFLPNLRRSASSLKAALSAADAVAAAAEHLGLEISVPPQTLTVGDDPQQTTRLDGTGLSFEDIEAKLMLLPINRGNARLVWNFQLQTLDSQHWYDFNVDAVSGKVWTRFDWINGTSYRVYPRPVESPNHTTPLPPNDARVLVSNPENALASPDGWFHAGTTIMDGNNVHACIDANANNACDTPEASCGAGLNCDFPINLSTAPSNSRPAAVANLFYWNNIIHDVQYQHGFTEAAGNFQENNFGRGGAGSDSVNADGQDGSGNCNANFGTPADGGNPRMQMFLCSNASPSRDGDFDAGVIVHEYGHGISNRQVGGPNTTGCLSNAQQGGEGWSDWHALVYTAKASDTGPQPRGVGSYLFALAPDGTIRPQRYSTSSSINNYTYASISGQSIPHGVGSVWAQAIWEVYWALVDKHGFDSNLYNAGSAPGAAGNTRALTYINEGFKFTACGPTFIDARNGIIDAATNLHGGEDVCDIWAAFAAFGLGIDASTPGPNSTSATNGFNVPAACEGPPPPSGCPAGSIDFNSFGLESYSNQNVSNSFFVADGGDTLVLQNNTWLRSTQSFNVAAGTVVEFEFAGGPQGEIHAIGFDENQTLNDDPRHFQFWGTQNWTGTGKAAVTSPQYNGSGSFQSFSIPVGQTYTGASMRLVFTNDQDSGSGATGRFRCVRVVTSDQPPNDQCTVDDDFENGAAGWFNDGASTCTTGAFVLATPTLVTNGGVTTQVGGDHTSGAGNAIFTATNSSAGVNDVDGGVCILGSPTWNVTDASTLSVWYFHGQRDQGDDPGGDFFSLEVSINGGAFTPFVSIGDVTTNAAWTNATTSIPAGASVQLRLRVSDGAGPGDLIEGGIDDLSICPQ